MYQRFLTFSLIFIAAVAEVSFSPGLFFGRVAPDIVLVLVIIWSGRKNFESFWLWAIVCGFVLDALTFERIGINAILFLIISFGINFLAKRFFVGQQNRAFFWTIVLVLAGTGVNYILGIGLNVAIGTLTASAFNSATLLFKIINNLLLAAVIYWPVISLRQIFPVEESRLVVR